MLALSALDVKFTPPKAFDRSRLDVFVHKSSDRANLRPLLLAMAMLSVLVSLWLFKPHRAFRYTKMRNFASETG